MSKPIQEQLSSFMDDELNDAQSALFVRRLAADPELRASALRYRVIGEALRNELAPAHPVAFAERVSRALAGEAAAVAPAAWSRGLRPVIGAAVAASVAVVAIIALRNGTVDAPVTVPVAVEATAPSVSYTVPRAYPRQAGGPDRLSNYYLNHSEYATLLGDQGPLIRIVSGPPGDGQDEPERTPETPPADAEAR